MKRHFFRYCSAAIFCIGSLFSVVQAGLVPEGTRIIYHEGTKEKYLSVGSANNYPVIVQTWVDEGTANSPEYADSPFISLPPMFNLMPNAISNVKIVVKNLSLPADRESVYWLNLHEIPPTQKQAPENSSQISMATTTQMKIFYRPTSLRHYSEADILSQLKNLQFTLTKNGDDFELRCHNPTPFSASFSGLALEVNGKHFQAESQLDMMTLPFSSKNYVFKQLPASAGKSITLKYLLIDGNGQSHVFSTLIAQP